MKGFINQRLGRIAAASLLCLLSAGLVFAQDDEAPAKDDERIEELVVTASRIAGNSGFVAPQPVTTVSALDFQAYAANNVQEVLYELPQVARESVGGTGSGNPGGDYINLRNIGSSRTLVLIDGRRVVPTNINGTVDLNLIPSSLIQRLEIVTGGASAAWGSDAVSGVVNIIMKKDYEGFDITTQYGVSEVGDGGQTKLQIAGGNTFMDGRLHMMVSAETVNKVAVSSVTDRDWGVPNYAAIQNPDYAGSSGSTPRYLEVDDATFSRMTAGGVIMFDESWTGSTPIPETNSYTPGIQFGPGGVPIPFNYGPNVTNLYMQGGDGGWLGGAPNLQNPHNRQSVYSRATFDVSPKLSLFAEASYGSNKTRYDIIIPYDFSLIRIQRDNAFLHPSIAAMMDAAGETEFDMGRLQYEYGPDITQGINETRRWVIGAEGNFSDKWSYSAYYQHGSNDYENIYRARVKDRFLLQIDAVVDPATGATVCRSTLTDPTNGCVPANMFGPGSVSQSAVDYANDWGWFTSTYDQEVVAFDVQGQFGELWAGPVSVAAGLEYRNEKLDGASDEISQATGFRLANRKPLAGEETVKEGYVEFAIPLAQELPWAQHSDLNLAARYTAYDLAGSVTTWKVGLSHQFGDQTRFRATRSRDLRAPKLSEMFSPSSSGSGTLVDPIYNVPTRIITTTTGNIALTPESAETWTYGFVYQPSWLQGLQLSVDYFDIDITDAIGTVGTQSVLDRCAAGDQSLCALISRDPITDLMTEVTRPQLNLNSLKARGIDFEASYGTNLGSGDLRLRLVYSDFLEDSTETEGSIVDTEGQIGNDARASFMASYVNGPLTLAGNVRYDAGGTQDNTWADNDGRRNDYGSYFVAGASIRYAFVETDARRISGFFRINNLLDRDPPITYSTRQQPTRTNQATYDTVGRFYSAGMNLQF